MLSVSEIAQSLSGLVEGDASLVVDTIRPVVSDIHGGSLLSLLARILNCFLKPQLTY